MFIYPWTTFDDLTGAGAGWGARKGKGTSRERQVQHMGRADRPAKGNLGPSFRNQNLSLNLCFLSREKWGWESKVHHFSMPCHGAATCPSLKVWAWGIGSGAASLAQRCPPKAELPIKPSPTGWSTGRGEDPSSFPLTQRSSEGLGKSNSLALNFAV